MTIQRGGKKEGAGKRGGKVDKTPPHPPHDMKQVHRSINFIKGKKWVSLFFECQNPGCDHKDSTVKKG
jgi:hypothetical protein